MGNNQQYLRNSEIVVTELDGSLMMMSIEEGKYFELNTVSKRIWELFEQPNTAQQVIETLLNEFEVSREECEGEVFVHIEELIKKKILFKV